MCANLLGRPAQRCAGGDFICPDVLVQGSVTSTSVGITDVKNITLQI